MHRLASELAKRGHDVTCLFNARDAMPTPADAATLEKVTQAGAKIIFFDLQKLSALLPFRRYLKAENFHVIHSHRTLVLQFTTLAAMGLHTPVFVTNRGTTFPLRSMMERWLFRREELDRVIAVAEAVKDSLIDPGKVRADKIDVIYGSVDLEQFNRERVNGAEARAKFGVPANALVVGTVATYAPKKGYGKFFRAARRVLSSISSDIGQPVLFMAVGGGVEEKYAPLIDSLGIRDHLILTGYCEDVPSALAAMDLFVCASTMAEGLTGSVREAMAMGVPVISTDVSGNGEIVIPGKTGTLVPTNDSDALALAILDAFSNREVLAQMARNGLDLIGEKIHR